MSVKPLHDPPEYKGVQSARAHAYSMLAGNVDKSLEGFTTHH